MAPLTISILTTGIFASLMMTGRGRWDHSTPVDLLLVMMPEKIRAVRVDTRTGLRQLRTGLVHDASKNSAYWKFVAPDRRAKELSKARLQTRKKSGANTIARKRRGHAGGL